MLSLTKKTEYALMALGYLHRHGEEICSAREISDACHIPLPLLMNILKTLAQHDIVGSMRGARGGYTLAAPAEGISLARVVEIVEGPVRLVQCVGDEGREVGHEDRCEMMGCCTVRSPLLKIHQEFEGFLGRITVASLAQQNVTKVRLPQESV